MTSEFRPAVEVRKELVSLFPRLATTKWRLSSPFDKTYKCIAWAACRTDNIWWPVDGDPLPQGVYWPPSVPVDEKVETFTQAFSCLGYVPCNSEEFEFGYQKVAIYALDLDNVTHMARQHFMGRGWLSKLGYYEDIVHADLRCIETDPQGASNYGTVAKILKRSWWSAFYNLCVFRCSWHALKFLVYRGIWRLLELKWKMKNEKAG